MVELFGERESSVDQDQLRAILAAVNEQLGVAIEQFVEWGELRCMISLLWCDFMLLIAFLCLSDATAVECGSGVARFHWPSRNLSRMSSYCSRQISASIEVRN
jgi:hypothetical protein